MSKKNIIVVAYPDRGAGNDPNFFFFFFFFFLGGGGGGGGSLSPPRLNIFTVGNKGAMICLGQGGLRSLSASSLFMELTWMCEPGIASLFLAERISVKLEKRNKIN